MTDEKLQDYKRGTERRIADLLSELEATTGVHVGCKDPFTPFARGTYTKLPDHD